MYGEEEYDQYDIWYIKSVRFDIDDCLGREDRRPGRLGAAFILNLAHARRFIVSAVTASQKTLDWAFCGGRTKMAT